MVPAAMAFTPAQRKSLQVGLGLIFGAAVIIAVIWMGTYLPGFAGELFSMLAGLMWTPLVLDASLLLIGLILVLWINKIARAREGDEFVYLEQVEGPDVPADLPPDSRSAVFADEPPPRDHAPALAAIEGALQLNDPSEASRLLFELPQDSLEEPEVLALRIRLARLQGHDETAQKLLEELRVKSPNHSLLQDPDRVPDQDLD